MCVGGTGERTGVSGTEVAKRLGVTQPAVSQAVKRGARIIEESHLKLKEE